MERSFDPSVIKGSVKAPSSKSMTQRAIAAALLAEGRSLIHNPSYCDDALAAMSIAAGLGAKLEPQPDMLAIEGSAVLKETKLNCGESGLAIRMFSPIAALYPVEITMSGAASLKKRPMGMIGEALVQLGAVCKSTDGFLPLTIKGPLKGGECDIDGSVSSQLLTGLLMALPLANKDSLIKVKNLKSKPYIDMTLHILKTFGIAVENEGYESFRIKGKQKYVPSEYSVEGDWSGAAFLLVAGAINGDLTVTGLSKNSTQSDMAICKALDSAGAKLEALPNDSFRISRSELSAFTFDATHCPDLFPPLVSLAAYCRGESKIKGVSRLVHKESDRAKTLREEFGKMNISIEINDDVMNVTGGQPEGGHVESHGDHRIAMAAAITALRATGTVYLRDSHVAAKSYPEFYRDMAALGARIHE
jgi:3-phosphoshikimate 1-carboxyvinyltransferase